MRLKNSFLLILILFVSILTTLAPNNFTVFANDLVKYDGEIAHLFTHCLIAYPDLAFKQDNFMRNDYDKDCLTTSEFKGILAGLYQNDYVLVKASEVYDIKNDRAYKKTLLLPKGKKTINIIL